MVKVVTILGTRPEIIRLSCVIRLLDEHVDHCLVHTGQNYDYELNEVFFSDLELRRPDHFLGVGGSSVGKTYGDVLMGVERVLIEEQPDAVLILGDTNSAIGAIVAKRMRIPIYHMEAGNRSFDLNVPEEINRRIVDHVADFNLVYTERSRQHLLAEGLPARRIYLTGSPMREVLRRCSSAIESSNILDRLRLSSGGYFMVSIHREENVDAASRLRQVLAALEGVERTYELPLVFSTHPRTGQRLEALHVGPSPRFRFLKPFGFVEYVKLQKEALCVISDSGTIAEESAILGFPAVTLRDSMERPEALDSGSLMIAPLEPAEALVECVRLQLSLASEAGSVGEIPWEYEIGNTAERVVKLIIGTARLSNQWDGIRGAAT